MLNCILIGPTLGLRLALQGMSAALGDIYVLKALETYPTLGVLTGLLNALSPDVVLLEIGATEQFPAIVRQIREVRPRAALIGFTRKRDRERLDEAIQLGVEQILLAPFTLDEFQEALWESFRALPAPIFSNLVTFVPAKPGSGASTIALNVTGILAGQAGQDVLLIDGDREAGVLAMLLNVQPRNTLVNALRSSNDLNYGAWAYRSRKAKGFDLLAKAARTQSKETFPPWCYHRLLSFVQGRYDTVIIDLSHVIETEQETLVRQAGAVFVVCTPEPASLALARQQFEVLKEHGVEERRIGVILNRRLERDKDTLQIEKILERPLYATLPYDYVSVWQAEQVNKFILDRSELGAAMSWLTYKLARLPVEELPSPASERGLRSLFRKRVAEAAVAHAD